MADTVDVRNMRLVNPRGTDLAAGDFELNERSGDLSGMVLGLLENSKANSDKVLWELSAILKQRHDIKDVVMFSKHSASLPTKPETVQDMLDQVDALIVGVGD